MGWFNKKEEKAQGIAPSMPSLPDLPELPKLEENNFNRKDKKIHQLPSFPTNSFGEKFSQNAIKEAVSGEKEDDEGFEADDFAFDREKTQMMHKPLKKPMTKEIFKDRRIPIALMKEIDKEETTIPKIPSEFKEAQKITKKSEPIFIRLDKFEQSLDTFEKAKKQIEDIQKLLGDIKKLKDEEEEELASWEKEMGQIKEQLDKVDRDVFSKVE